MALSRHAGFFASLQRVEDRLALEGDKEKPQSTGTTTTAASPLVFLDHPASEATAATMTAASPLVFLDHPAAAATGADSSGPALDFLTLTRRDEEETDADRGEDGIDIERLIALLGLSPPRDVVHGAGCDCSGPDGFMAKVVGVVGPKCDREKGRLDSWIQHYRRPSSDGGCLEPARLAHLLIAKASSTSWDGRAFPATVKEYLDRDAPPTE